MSGVSLVSASHLEGQRTGHGDTCPHQVSPHKKNSLLHYITTTTYGVCSTSPRSPHTTVHQYARERVHAGRATPMTNLWAHKPPALEPMFVLPCPNAPSASCENAR